MTHCATLRTYEANRWYQRATELAGDAPDGTAELHQAWLDEYAQRV